MHSQPKFLLKGLLAIFVVLTIVFTVVAFLPIAHAMPGGNADQAGGGRNIIAQFVPLILIFAIFWFLMIRPQQKRAKEHRALLEALKVGDNVITDSGIHGKIVKLGEQTVTLEIASRVSIVLSRPRIAGKTTGNATASSATASKKTPPSKPASKAKAPSKTSKSAKNKADK